MDVWNSLADALLLSEADRKDIRRLRRSIAAESGDARAISHVQLYQIYSTAAEQRFISAPLRRFAQLHLDEAVMRANVWPEPLGICGVQQIAAGDLCQGVELLSRYSSMQRVWLEHAGEVNSAECLVFLQRLIVGASAYSQLGQYPKAREWYAEVLGQLQDGKYVDQSAKNARETSLMGVVNCLVLEFNYPEALRFIEAITAQPTFASVEPSTKNHLFSTKALLGKLKGVVDHYEPPSGAAALWASLLEAIQRCDTPEQARETLREIRRKIKLDDTNNQIQILASAVENVIAGQQTRSKESVSPEGSIELPELTPVDLSGIHDPAIRAQTQAVADGTRSMLEQQRQINKILDKLIAALAKASQRLTEANIKRVRKLAAKVYRIPFRFRVHWFWLSMIQFAVQIIVVAYVIDKVVFDGIIEKRGDVLSRHLEIWGRELLVPGMILVIGFVAGNFVEKAIGNRALPTYKRLLSRIVSNRASTLWTTYNTLLAIMTQVNEALGELEKRAAGVAEHRN